MKAVLLFFILASFVACKTNSENKGSIKLKSYDSAQINDADGNEDSMSTTKISDVKDTSTSEEDYSENMTTDLTGRYTNTSSSDAPANCNNIDINYTTPTEICIDKDGMTIKVSYTEVGEKTQMFFSSLVSNTTDKDVPFDTFDTTTPIAVITSNTNKTLTLDWKGFSINGDIATDYAILGKKNLEGTFEKQ